MDTYITVKDTGFLPIKPVLDEIFIKLKPLLPDYDCIDYGDEIISLQDVELSNDLRDNIKKLISEVSSQHDQAEIYLDQVIGGLDYPYQSRTVYQNGEATYGVYVDSFPLQHVTLSEYRVVQQYSGGEIVYYSNESEEECYMWLLDNRSMIVMLEAGKFILQEVNNVKEINSTFGPVLN